MSAGVFVKNLQLRNFRSVRFTNLSFDNPLFLVGRNGSGKSNVVDAFAFLADCVNLSLKAAMEKRDGLGRVGYIGMENAWPFIDIKADVCFGNSDNHENGSGSYLLRLKITNRDYAVDTEECFVNRSGVNHFFKRNGSHFEASVPGLNPRLGSQNLALPIVGGIEEFALLADGFAAMRVYHIDHRKIRVEDGADTSAVLDAAGTNVAGVLHHLQTKKGLRGINDIFRAITPTPVDFGPVALKDGKWTFFGSQRWETDMGAAVHDRGAFSDGTLHALGVAVALQQNPLPSVLVIEEPENNLHPGALSAIADLIEEASRKTQVIITTHSPDLLDAKWIRPQNLRVVTWENDASRVSELAERPKKALREHLMYAGQLMRANALEPAPAETTVEATNAEPIIAAL